MDNKQEKKQADTPPRGFLDQIFFAESQLDFSRWQVGLTILHKKSQCPVLNELYNKNRI